MRALIHRTTFLEARETYFFSFLKFYTSPTTGGLSSRLEKKPTINSWTRHALYNSVLSYERNRWKFEHVIRNSMGNGIWLIYNDKYLEILIFYT